MHDVKYIGMDVHKEAISIAVLNATGKLVMECAIEAKAITILDFLKGLRGSLHVTFEEGTWAAWLYDLMKPDVVELIVCNPRRNALLKEGSKSDRIDARKLADLLRSNMVRSVYHGEHGVRALKELARSYLTISKDLMRVMTRVKAIYRSWVYPARGNRSMHPAIVLNGSRRSTKRECAAGRSSTTSSSMRCGCCARKCGANCWPNLRSTTPGNCYARFRSLARSGRRC